MVPIPIQFFHTVWQVFTEYYGTFPVHIIMGIITRLSQEWLPYYHGNL
jgi:hypothetical protein